MAFALTSRPRNYNLLVGALGIVGVGVMLAVMSRSGAGLSPDSVHYVFAAREFALGRGIFVADSNPLVEWAPLYSAVLAAIQYIFGIDPLNSIPFVNAFVVGLIVYLSGMLLFRHLASPLLAILGTLVVLLSHPVSYVGLMAWSEPLFICLLLAYFLAFDSYRAEPQLSSLVWMSVAAALVMLTRYVGLVLVPVGVASILLLTPGNLKSRSAASGLFILIAGSPLALWLVRNYAISGTLLGVRALSSFSFFQNVSLTLKTIFTWFLPSAVPGQPIVIGLAVVLLIVAAVLSFKNNWARVRALWAKNGALLIWVVAYVGFLILSATTTAYDVIDERLLSPIYIPLIVLALALLEEIAAPYALGEHRRVVNALLFGGIALWMLYPLGASAYNINRFLQEGGSGYNDAAWRTSQTLAYLESHPELAFDCPLYSNGPDAIYIRLNLQAQQSPAEYIYNSPEIVNTVAGLRGKFPAEGRICLVWLNDIPRDFLFSIQELGDIANVRQTNLFSDGAIYVVMRKAS